MGKRSVAERGLGTEPQMNNFEDCIAVSLLKEATIVSGSRHSSHDVLSTAYVYIYAYDMHVYSNEYGQHTVHYSLYYTRTACTKTGRCTVCTGRLN